MSSEESPSEDSSHLRERMNPLKDKLPPPDDAEVEPVEEPDAEAAEQSAEDVWDEDYDEHIDGDEPPTPRPRKKKHIGALVTAVIVLLVIIVWTAFAPQVMPEAPTMIPNPAYSNLSMFTGTIETYAGDSTWSMSVGGPENVSAGQGFNLMVQISKSHDHPSNWWFTGTSITLKNVSVLGSNASFVSAMTAEEDRGYGFLLTVPVLLSSPGDYDLYVYAKFTIYSCMRIGFLPTKVVKMESDHFIIHAA